MDLNSSLYLCLFVDDTTQNTVALIETYRNFPSASPVATFLLACSGFGYTGFGDRVVCSRYVVLFSM